MVTGLHLQHYLHNVLIFMHILANPEYSAPQKNSANPKIPKILIQTIKCRPKPTTALTEASAPDKP